MGIERPSMNSFFSSFLSSFLSIAASTNEAESAEHNGGGTLDNQQAGKFDGQQHCLQWGQSGNLAADKALDLSLHAIQFGRVVAGGGGAADAIADAIFVGSDIELHCAVQTVEERVEVFLHVRNVVCGVDHDGFDQLFGCRTGGGIHIVLVTLRGEIGGNEICKVFWNIRRWRLHGSRQNRSRP